MNNNNINLEELSFKNRPSWKFVNAYQEALMYCDRFGWYTAMDYKVKDDCLSTRQIKAIFAGKYIPNKKTLLKMCIDMKLDIQHSYELLHTAGYTFASAIKQDVIVEHFIRNHCYDKETIDYTLIRYFCSELFDSYKNKKIDKEKLEDYIKLNYDPNYVATSTFNLPDGSLETVEIGTPKYFKLIHVKGVKSFSDLVNETIEKRGLEDREVYKAALISRQLLYNIRYLEDYNPDFNTAVKICFAFKLSYEEALSWLETASYTLSKAKKKDLIISEALEDKCYDLDDVDNKIWKALHDIKYLLCEKKEKKMFIRS